MADKTSHELDTASTLTGKYIAIDSSGLPEAEKTLISNFATQVALGLVTIDVVAAQADITTLQNNVQTNTDDIVLLAETISGFGVKEKLSLKTSDVSFLLPSNCAVDCIDFQVLTNTMTIRCGTSVGDNDVILIDTYAIGNYRIPINRVDLSNETLYFTISGSGTVTIIIFYQENWF